ncbi:MAG: 16S rRNA (guanine(527)-N(7))-methyltransferase RsmG [Actinomycetota bacterium]
MSKAELLLQRYAQLIRYWGSRLNLLSDADLERLEDRHLADSLRLAPLIDDLEDGPAVDVGSGAGLPGIPLAISDPARWWRLLEPRKKRSAFLEEVVRELDLPNCEVLTKTAREAAADPALRERHAVATARALAPPHQALPKLRPLVRPGGVCLLLAGSVAELPPEADWAGPGIARLVVPPAKEGPGA